MMRRCVCPSCHVVVRVGQWMCADHWFAVPEAKRDRLLAAWRAWNRARPDASVSTKARLTAAYSNALQAAVDSVDSRYTDIFGNPISAKVTAGTAGAVVGCHASETGRAEGAGTLYAASARPFTIVPFLGEAS